MICWHYRKVDDYSTIAPLEVNFEKSAESKSTNQQNFK